MNAQLSESQIGFYQENGYVVIEDFLMPKNWKHGAPR
jgi:hypothetical protein